MKFSLVHERRFLSFYFIFLCQQEYTTVRGAGCDHGTRWKDFDFSYLLVRIMYRLSTTNILHASSHVRARQPWPREHLLRERAIALGQAIDISTWNNYHIITEHRPRHRLLHLISTHMVSFI